MNEEKLEEIKNRLPKKIDSTFLKQFYRKIAEIKFNDRIDKTSNFPEELDLLLLKNGLKNVDCTQIDFSEMSLEEFELLPFDKRTKFSEETRRSFPKVFSKDGQELEENAIVTDEMHTKRWQSMIENVLSQVKIDDDFIKRTYGRVSQAKFVFGEADIFDDAMFMNGLSGIDCRKFDFSDLSKENFACITFDSFTKFPKEIEKDFYKILEDGKKVGLGFEDLIKDGKLSGEDIHIAIADQEFDSTDIDSDDLQIIEHFEKNGTENFHGKTASSLLASKSCGVAKGAKVHFCSGGAKSTDFFSYIIEYNSNAKDEDKILVLSGSWRMKDFEKWRDKLREAGCEVVCQNNFIENFSEFIGDGETIFDFSEEEMKQLSTERRAMLEGLDIKRKVKIPIDRTYYQFGSDGGYKYQAVYSNSWGVPQIAGMLAMFRGIDRSLTFESFSDICRETSNENGIINPTGIYEKVMERMKSQEIENIPKVKESKEVEKSSNEGDKRLSFQDLGLLSIAELKNIPKLKEEERKLAANVKAINNKAKEDKDGR